MTFPVTSLGTSSPHALTQHEEQPQQESQTKSTSKRKTTVPQRCFSFVDFKGEFKPDIEKQQRVVWVDMNNHVLNIEPEGVLRNTVTPPIVQAAVTREISPVVPPVESRHPVDPLFLPHSVQQMRDLQRARRLSRQAEREEAQGRSQTKTQEASKQDSSKEDSSQSVAAETSKTYQCAICSKTYRSEVYFYSHVALCGNFKCDICGKTYRSQGSLHEHSKRHDPGKHLKCEFCEYITTKPSTMDKHMVKHTHDKPYKCPYCEKCYRFKESFTKHIRKDHSGNDV